MYKNIQTMFFFHVLKDISQNCKLVSFFRASQEDRDLVGVGSPFGVDPVSEIKKEVVKDGRVDVLAHLHEQEPVAVVAFLQDGADIVAVDGAAAVAEKQIANITKEKKERFTWGSDLQCTPIRTC